MFVHFGLSNVLMCELNSRKYYIFFRAVRDILGPGHTPAVASQREHNSCIWMPQVQDTNIWFECMRFINAWQWRTLLNKQSTLNGEMTKNGKRRTNSAIQKILTSLWKHNPNFVKSTAAASTLFGKQVHLSIFLCTSQPRE